jgi:hypothetical protein
MRTKTLLLTAVLGIASAAASMAQAVYSVNVVGYVNLTMKRGFNLVANQLDATPDNKLSSVLPSVPNGSQALKFVNNNYTRDDFSIADGGWIDAETLEPSVRTVSPGEGFFYYNPTAGDLTVTTVGQVRTGNGLSVPLAGNGFSLISGITPQDLTLNNTPPNTFPVVAGVQYLSHNATSQDYNVRLDYDATDGWVNSETLDPVAAPVITVGQGVFTYNPGAATSWTRNFNPNNP